MLQFIIKYYDKDINLNLLSEYFHFTPTYISRFIRSETGYTFSSILTSVRLTHAAHMLENNDDSICGVCEQNGFSDQRYFSKVFKKAFGTTPSEYKKKPVKLKFIEILDAIQS